MSFLHNEITGKDAETALGEPILPSTKIPSLAKIVRRL